MDSKLSEESSSGGSWLRALTRLLLLRGSTAVPTKASLRVIELLAVVSLGTWIGVDWLRHQPDPVFYPYGLPDLAWYALMALAMAGVMARRAAPGLAFGRVLTFVLAAAPLAIIALYLIQFHLSHPGLVQAALFALCVYLIVYMSKSLRALSGSAQPRAFALGILLATGFVWTTDVLFIDPSVWSEAEEEDDSDIAPEQAESLLFSQSQRIDAEVARMQPSKAGATSAFFVGFAGYADQRVFAEEIKLAALTVGTRYGSQWRNLLLLNDQRSLDEAPLASPTALRYALHAVAAKMDLDRDVLFLSLSSHGSSDGSLSVSNGSLIQHDLTAADLASALRESGIQWRVVVVSACYSGSFIEPLRSARTAVITASAADRTSFGCSDDRDLTYFGEAFYRDALPAGGSLRGAFEKTKAAIAAREDAEDVEPSHPQAFFGAEIERKLEELNRAP